MHQGVNIECLNYCWRHAYMFFNFIHEGNKITKYVGLDYAYVFVLLPFKRRIFFNIEKFNQNYGCEICICYITFVLKDVYLCNRYASWRYIWGKPNALSLHCKDQSLSDIFHIHLRLREVSSKIEIHIWR